MKEKLHKLSEGLDKDGVLRRKNIKIKACGVWDTVGSLGLPLPRPLPRPLENIEKLCAIDPHIIENAYHALSLHERRWHFQPVLWNSDSPYIKQCWFAGSHGGVGGGDERESTLANISLAWMVSQLYDFVDFDLQALSKFKKNLSSEDSQMAIEVYKPPLFWRLAGTKPRKPGSGNGRYETIHFSLWNRQIPEFGALMPSKDRNGGRSWSYNGNNIEEEAQSKFEIACLKQWGLGWLSAPNSPDH
jgi:hypothetical protein